MVQPNYVQPLSFQTGGQQGPNFNWDSVFPQADYVNQLGGQSSQFQLPQNLSFGSGMSGGNDWLQKLGGFDGLLGNLGSASSIFGNVMTGINSNRQMKLAEKNSQFSKDLMRQQFTIQAKEKNDDARRRNMMGGVSGFGKTGAGGRYIKENLAA